MVHCSKCGTAIPPDARFCNNCGETQPVTASPAASAQTGLSENAAAALSYALGWFTGIIFFLIDQRPYVRFHAAQSIVAFGGLNLIRGVLAGMFCLGWVMGFTPDIGRLGTFSFAIGLLSILSFFTLLLWIFCMVKAYQGQRFVLPIAGDIATNLTNR